MHGAPADDAPIDGPEWPAASMLTRTSSLGIAAPRTRGRLCRRTRRSRCRALAPRCVRGFGVIECVGLWHCSESFGWCQASYLTHPAGVPVWVKRQATRVSPRASSSSAPHPSPADEFRRFIAEFTEKWAKVIRAAGIKANSCVESQCPTGERQCSVPLVQVSSTQTRDALQRRCPPRAQGDIPLLAPYWHDHQNPPSRL
jgi:hypothetical protein